jgi:glycerol-3-phosphate dehydrogenase
LIAAESGLPLHQVERLINRYGSLLPELLNMIKDSPALASSLDGAPHYLQVEAMYGASHEGALHLDDFLTRRTHISIETPDRGVRAAAEVAALVAPILGWHQADIAREVSHYRLRVAAELESQDQADDHSADAARLGAPDVRMGGMGLPESR